MSLSGEFALLLVLLLLAAALGGAFARLLRLPAAPVQLLFGLLLAHGPSAVVDVPAAVTLQLVVPVALLCVALAAGARCRPPARAFAAPLAAPVPGPGAHLLAEVALVPLLVWLAITTLGGVPAQVALIVGLLALASAADLIESLGRRAGAEALARVLGAVARADAAVSLGLALAATALLRLRFDPPQRAPGPELTLLLLGLLLGASLTFSAPSLLLRVEPLLARASNFALGVLGVLAGAVVLPSALPRGLFIAALVCTARVLGKALAAGWADRDARGGAWRAGLLLAPGTLAGVGVILLVRDEPALADFRELFLAVGFWVATLNTVLGPFVARLALPRAGAVGDLSPRERRAAPRETPPES